MAVRTIVTERPEKERIVTFLVRDLDLATNEEISENKWYYSWARMDPSRGIPMNLGPRPLFEGINYDYAESIYRELKEMAVKTKKKKVNPNKVVNETCPSAYNHFLMELAPSSFEKLMAKVQGLIAEHEFLDEREEE